jgi:hypothetical protein
MDRNSLLETLRDNPEQPMYQRTLSTVAHCSCNLSALLHAVVVAAERLWTSVPYFQLVLGSRSGVWGHGWEILFACMSQSAFHFLSHDEALATEFSASIQLA